VNKALRAGAQTGDHVAVRALVRGVPLPEGARYRVGTRELLILGRAKAAEWPDADVEKGDLDSIIWCLPADYGAVAAELLANDRVIAVRVESAG
jgi:hypothetical protein